MSEGKVVFSPISHSHNIADHLDEKLRTDQEFWMTQDLPFIGKCDRMIVVQIVGAYDGDRLIGESKGCQAEIIEAINNEIVVDTHFYYLHETEVEQKQKP